MAEYLKLNQLKSDTTILMNEKSIPQTRPLVLNFHLVVALNITAEIAQHRVNQELIPELGTGLIACRPELMIDGEKITWQVPINLSLPKLGDLGQVGWAIVDAFSGELLTHLTQR